MNKLPKVEVLQLAKYYKREEIVKAKAVLCSVCKQNRAAKAGVKYEQRRNSNRRDVKEMDLDNIYTHMAWLQAGTTR